MYTTKSHFVLSLLLPLFTTAIPTPHDLTDVSFSAPLPSKSNVLKRQDPNTCPNVDAPTDSDPSVPVVPAITNIELPNSIYLNQAAQYLGDNNDGDVTDPTPGVGDIDVTPTGGTKKRDLALVERSPGRLFEAAGYR